MGSQLNTSNLNVIDTFSWQTTAVVLQHRQSFLPGPITTGDEAQRTIWTINYYQASTTMAQLCQADGGLAYTEGPKLIGPPLSLKNMLDQVVKMHPESDAVVSMHQHGYAGQPVEGNEGSVRPPLRYTFSGLHHLAASFAVALYDRGLRPGQPIVVFLYNCAEFAIALWAAAKLNAPFVPLDPKMLANRAEVEHCLQVIKPAVILADGDLTDELQALLSPHLSTLSLKIATSDNEYLTTDWLPLSRLLNDQTSVESTAKLRRIDEIVIDVDADVAFVVFTSGTSGLPKACPHTSRTLWAGSMGTRWLRDLRPGYKLLQHMLSSHVFGYIGMLGFWTAGATVVFPSKTFGAKESLTAIETEQCTHASAVPTIIQALVSDPDFSPARVKTLRHVSLGVPGFGMSEGCPTLGWPASAKPAVEDGLASVGKVLPGVRVKICKPGSQECLPYDEVGELHVGGPAIIEGYMSSDSHAFYNNNGCHWLATGDQARMNKSGAVFMLGRYKDVINRAGEKLPPAKIEACINRIFPFITSQVVGIPDDIAGEVPAAVVSVPEGLRPDTQRIKAAVVGSLGLEFAPEIIVSLKEVGLQTFPTTKSGKVKKNELRGHLMRHIEAQGSNLKTVAPVPRSTKEAMIDILGALLGQSPADLPRDKAIPELLDSISTLRFLHELGKSLQKTVTMSHVQGATTLTELATSIDSHQAPNETTPTGPPDISRMSHESNQYSSRTQHLLKPTLERLSLTWANDVQDVYPMAGTAAFYGAREAPFSHQFTIPDKQDLRSIIAASLKAWPLFRCLCADYEPATRLWVVLRDTENFLNLAVSEHPDVEDLTELASLSIAPEHVLGQFPDSLSFRAVIANVKSTGTTGFVMLANHATYDFLSMADWKHDLERILTGQPAPEHVPFKLFADTYYLYRDSILAQRSITFHLRLLGGIGSLRGDLWPPRPIPSGQSEVTKPNGPVQVQKPNLTYYTRLSTLPTISSEHSIPAPAIFLAAIAIFNTTQTGQSHAILSILLAGRAWPFVSPDIAHKLPNPLNIAGPTFTYVTSVLQVDKEGTVETLLHHVVEQQKHLTEHQHVPPSMPHQLKAEDRAVWLESKRQICNWLPSMAMLREEEGEGQLELVKRAGYAGQDGTGFMWEGGLLDDRETVKVKAIWHRSLFSEEEIDGFLTTLVRIMELLAEVDNWGKSIGEMMDEAKLG
ncbi:MAG: hypothetical protein Q9186_007338 [Xanthomendoza sp. 1 TL-2023]